jgi:hypothetical protein
VEFLRSTASDALAAFDPQLLTSLIQHLRQQVSPRQIDATDDTCVRGIAFSARFAGRAHNCRRLKGSEKGSGVEWRKWHGIWRRIGQCGIRAWAWVCCRAAGWWGKGAELETV